LSMQVTFLTPSPGAKDYGPTFERGMVMSRVAGQEVEDYQYDGNHCVATNAARPWRTQMNILLSYAAFYNPLNLLRALTQRDSLWDYRVRYQLLGMLGVLKSFNAFKGWIFRLMRGPIQRHTESPHRTLASPRRSPPAAHLLDSKSLDQVTSVSSS